MDVERVRASVPGKGLGAFERRIMGHSNKGEKSIYETILDHMKVAVTCINADGKILYANSAAKKRPSKVPREAGVNIKECHKDGTNEKIAAIFKDFRNGRREPHHYVSTAGNMRELVTIIPVFEGDIYSGCVSHIHPLEVEGAERSFA